ncbi:hypothetical protein YM304_40690 [Ilumatobacter coccineus YM16-304]|uniref:Uncharacterized protein n=1 Tax=Ilumatobacter coccineus (strain NBRC 103263 / KCTC 29153 / YM16-304) TaxID=1313172 RepID=A0A6C7EDJ3_ILUCY|nr:hypothetical protein YM304_40690 [Ilumatobacter coccineus YM16-304]
MVWEPDSSVGWIDVDRDEARRVREMLGMLTAPEAVDPHGILPILIALSDRLFPGVTTQHTRAKYVLFCGWHLQRIAATGGSASLSARLRHDELELMRSLLDSDDHRGLFGRRSRENIRTTPISVYWSTLDRWGLIPNGFRLDDLSALAPGVSSGHAAQLSDDARLMAESKAVGILPSDFPPSSAGFPGADQELGLTREQADYLVDRVAATCGGTALHAALTDERLRHGRRPWSVDETIGGQAMTDARCFSELIHPARLAYTKLLIDDARSAEGLELGDMETQLNDSFAAWRDETDSRLDQLREWAGEPLDRLLADPEIRLEPRRRRFVRSAIDRVVADPDGCLDDPELHRLVRGIEGALKKNKARLGGGEPFRRWMKQPTMLASNRLDYRWGRVRGFADDIAEAS